MLFSNTDNIFSLLSDAARAKNLVAIIQLPLINQTPTSDRSIRAMAFRVLVALAVLSILIRNFWCRYLCPYGV